MSHTGHHHRRACELLPWQVREVRTSETRRVVKTFMFTDIVKSTNLIEAIGDEAWQALLRWHNQTLQRCSRRTTVTRRPTRATAFSWGLRAPRRH